ncbi:cell division protein [Candidatus Photodesmus katoptron]|uniref:Cell division protein FtsB n=1 Tax=Candidatus Photodesmus katoptron Akat1 TaxID=1236703 RepID=S3DKV9_9GAMM|nr:cell division protein FtsB [Candidatus Photodesmus katoptron]EPE37754.1 septum formation initiator [Candidatus Photodesmus katoptron Akat1]KEY90524.1 cell division protein [Candidatus Photodesmus katoptron]
MKFLNLVLLLLLVYLQYSLWFNKNGILDFYAVHNEIKVQRQINANLKIENDKIFAEITDLRQGFDAIEERARYELGMIKEGETFYRLVEHESK